MVRNELFTETCTLLTLIFEMIDNGGSGPNFVKQDKDSVVVPAKDDDNNNEVDSGGNNKKKHISTF